MRRAIDEVLASQRAMLERHGKKSADESTLARIYQGQLAELTNWLRTHKDVTSLSIDYGELLK
ncbi:MAG: hypothetical protein ACREFG_05935, partial [Chthoniobacterales bacterium]